jgi:hypothetical protein
MTYDFRSWNGYSGVGYMRKKRCSISKKNLKLEWAGKNAFPDCYQAPSEGRIRDPDPGKNVFFCEKLDFRSCNGYAGVGHIRKKCAVVYQEKEIF